MAYAVPVDMTRRYDARRLGDLVRDDGTRATPAQLLNDGNLQTALDDAASVIDGACLAGKRYTPADLNTLIGNDLVSNDPNQPGTSVAAKFLRRLNCDLAYGFLVSRRGFSRAETEAQAPMFDEALALLQRLREGELVFHVDANINAGLPKVDTLSSKIRLISSNFRVFGDLSSFPQARDWPFNHEP